MLVLGASATVDRRDVVPAAIERAGGTVEHLGMPVDPGNLTLLARARRELAAEFPADGFEHLAFWNPAYRRIEMHLRATRALQLRLGSECYPFQEGETLHTEHSHKYTVTGFQALAARAGFRPGQVWVDARCWFAVLWLEAPDR